MIGFMICCPMFALLSHRVRAGTLMAIGLSMWTLAAVAAALSRELYTLGLARMLIGIGEASFAGFVALPCGKRLMNWSDLHQLTLTTLHPRLLERFVMLYVD